MAREKISGIYCIENLVNSKKYIGLSNDIYRRWSNHLCELEGNYHVNIHLQNAWNKYGKEQFIFYILEKCDESKLNSREQFWIEYYDTFKYGYNRTIGGEGIQGFKLSKERREEISKSLTGRQCSEKTKKLFREHMKIQFQDEYFIMKFKENIESQKKPIKCYNKEGFVKEYPDIHSTGKELHIEPTNICKVLKGKQKTCGGYTFCYKDESITDDELVRRYTKEKQRKRKHTKSSVNLIDDDGNIICSYQSITEASKDNGNIDVSSIAKVCNGKLKTTHGLKFEYA